ncbi:thioredoxin [Mycoplasmopsis agalactiae]|uniref:thioredoxin n=1 Tax=Mycoplasmopsis agalactiae TaxID=2110 RepID=UPI001F2AEA71|nr:thioredoxin [Mycoplasmopsis agalactiae]MCE6115347.1 thioredoxin [Mycoplasmopsis agalactiae]
MTKMFWRDAKSLYENPRNADSIFFILFVLENDLNSRLMKEIVSKVENYFSKYTIIKFIEIDAVESGLYQVPNTRFQVLETPTFCILKNNTVYNLGHNLYPKEILIDWLQEAIN